MNRSILAKSQLSITPLGAGDLIDRAVRFYRKNFWTFVLIAAPPAVIGTVFIVSWTILGRNLFNVNSTNQLETGFYQVFLYLGGILIWVIQTIATMVVMGGASRNFVRHLLFDERITFRETYKNVKERVGGLILISVLIVTILSFFSIVLFYIDVLVITVGVMLFVYVFGGSQILSGIISTVFGIAVAFAGFWLFFLVVSRFVYVPQIMLVEGKSAFTAIGRSATLASKNVKRVAALFIFTIVATYSALALLYIPIGWYAWLSGVEFSMFFSADTIPAWYEIANQVVSQVSLILLTPIWMIGLCLLYVDERVRSEGYDIELMAARHLGNIPSVPETYVNPLQPALSDRSVQNKNDKKTQDSSFTTLGLDK